MTRFYAVVIDGERATFFAHADEDQAAEQEQTLICEGYESRAIGDIDGDAYLIVYRKPEKAVKRAKGYIRTPEGEIIPQNEAQAHRCRTCQSCEHCKGAGQ